MKLIYTILMSFLFIIPSLVATAQYGMGKIEEIEDVQKRKLIVIKEEPREKIVNKLTKKKKIKELENYKSDLAKYNEHLKEVVEKFWPYNRDGIQYKTFEEVEELNKQKSDDYAVLYCISKSPSHYRSGYIAKEGLNWTWDLREDGDDREYWNYFTAIIINRIEDLKKVPVFETTLPDIFPSKASLAYGVLGIQNYFDYRIRKKKNNEKIKNNEGELIALANAHRLKSMTLYLREDWLHKDLNEVNIKEYYPYTYKVCSREILDDVIINQKENAAYLLILPYVMSTSNAIAVYYVHTIIDAKTGDALGFIKPSTGAMMGAGYTGKAGKRTIEKKNLEKFAQQVSGRN